MKALHNQVLSAAANAKINLYLHITGKHQNGYHLLDSLVVFANVGDIIEVAPSHDLQIAINGDYAGELSPTDNSVRKSAEELRRYFSISAGADITLHKNLPIGAGIGGGSADAAAALKLLMRLWKINASPKELMSISLLLGADVPACLQSTSLYMSGIGEITEAAPKISGLYVLLASTGKPLLTKNVFAQYNGGFSAPAPHPKHFASNDDLIAFLKNTRNDLQGAAIQLMPEIAEIIAALEEESHCLLARMSGSGSTCFGLFAKRKFAEDAAVSLRNQYPSWWIRTAGIL